MRGNPTLSARKQLSALLGAFCFLRLADLAGLANLANLAGLANLANLADLAELAELAIMSNRQASAQPRRAADLPW